MKLKDYVNSGHQFFGFKLIIDMVLETSLRTHRVSIDNTISSGKNIMTFEEQFNENFGLIIDEHKDFFKFTDFGDVGVNFTYEIIFPQNGFHYDISGKIAIPFETASTSLLNHLLNMDIIELQLGHSLAN